jgi:hypothetical protein
MRRPARIAAAVLAVGLAACGSSPDERFELRTPGTDRVEPRVRELPGSAQPRTGKPTRAEMAVIRGWSDALRAGHVAEAARFFAVPSEVFDGVNPRRPLLDRDAVEQFNRGLPCGARLVATERGQGSLVIGTFRLTERPGRGKCDGVGESAATAFLIRDRRIALWLRVPVPVTQAPPDTGVS